MGRKNKKKKKDKQRGGSSNTVSDATLDAFEGARKAYTFLRDPECSLFDLAPSPIAIGDAEMEKLMSVGGAGTQTVDIIKQLNEKDNYKTFEELIIAVVQVRVKSWDVKRGDTQKLVPQKPSAPPQGGRPNPIARTKGPPGTDQVVQFLSAAHCTLFAPAFQPGKELLDASIELVEKSGAGVMTVIQIQELNSDGQTFKDIDALLRALRDKKSAPKKNTGKVGWDDLKEQYPGVDAILSFLTSSNMFLAETVITMDLMRQMMESVPGNDHRIILKYLNMFTEVSTKFASFSMLIDNLRRCARNDKTLETNEGSAQADDAKEARKAKKKKKKEARRLEKRKMAILEYETKKKNGQLTDEDVDPRMAFLKEDEARARRKQKKDSSGDRDRFDEEEEEAIPPARSGKKKKKDRTNSSGPAEEPLSEIEQMEQRKMLEMQRKAGLAGKGPASSSITRMPSALRGSQSNFDSKSSNRDPRGAMGTMRGKHNDNDGPTLPSIGKFPAL